MKERQIYHELWLQKKSTDEEGWHDLTEEEYQQILVSFKTIIKIFDINDVDASPIISGQTEI